MHGQKNRSEAGTGKSAQVLIWKSYKQVYNFASSRVKTNACCLSTQK